MHFGEVSSSATPPPWPCPAPGSLSPTQPGVPTQSPAQRPGPPLPRWPAVRSSPAPLGILSSPAGRLRGGTHVNEPTAARWSPQRSHPEFPLNNTSQLLSHSFRTGRPVSFGRTGHFPTFPDPGVARWQQTETRRAEPSRAVPALRPAPPPAPPVPSIPARSSPRVRRYPALSRPVPLPDPRGLHREERETHGEAPRRRRSAQPDRRRRGCAHPARRRRGAAPAAPAAAAAAAAPGGNRRRRAPSPWRRRLRAPRAAAALRPPRPAPLPPPPANPRRGGGA